MVRGIEDISIWNNHTDKTPEFLTDGGGWKNPQSLIGGGWNRWGVRKQPKNVVDKAMVSYHECVSK